MSASLTFYVVFCTTLMSSCLANFGDFSVINALVRDPTRGINCMATYGTSLVIGTENSICLYNEQSGVDEITTGQSYNSVFVVNDTAYFGLKAQYLIKGLSSFGEPSSPISGITSLMFSTIFKHNGLLYFGTPTSPAHIFKVNESNPNTALDSLQLPYPVISSIVIGNRVYFGCDSPNNTIVATVDLDTFTSNASYVFNDNPGKSIGGIVYKDMLFYASSATGDILTIDIINGTFSSFVSGLADAVTMVTRDHLAYIVYGEGTIVKIDLDSFSFVDSKILPPGITSGVVIGSYAYFATPNSTIYKAHIPLDCPDALGGLLPHGTNRTVYGTAETCATLCESFSGYITCNDGDISGDTLFPYIYTSCRAVPCCNSSFGFLGLGQTIEVYEHSIVACGDICVPGNITCESDGLQGDITWKYSNCTQPTDNCPCIERSMLHNQTKLFYLNSNGDCINGCIGGNLTCLNGTIHGNTTYTKEDCSKTSQCPCTTVVGGDLGEGESRLVYSAPKASCTSTCSAYSTIVTCRNGKPLFNSLGDFPYLNCTECGVEPISLQNATNATLALPTSTVKMFFPATSNVTVTFGEATPSNVEYRDPSVDPPGDFLGTTFFITFYEDSDILHIPPAGTFIEISTNITESPTLFYYSDGKWTQNCKDIEKTLEGIYRVELCHATQYAIFNLKFSSTINLTAIVIVVIVLVAVIAVLSAAFVYYRRKVKKTAQNIEMNPIVHHNTIEGVKVGHRLGTGNFGEVYKGEWKGTEVALKKLKNSSEEFIKESEMLSKFSHPNIVQFMGIYVNEQGEQYLVTEFMAKGDLLSLMRREPLKKEDLNSIARQIAAGMVYLSDQNIVHRDLALRNILVAANETVIVKVSDFGLSRAVSTEDNYYTKEGSQLPVKWSAPESLKYGKFSSKSDVWSYGVCIWELFSKGETPYFTMSNAETLDKVVNEGYRLPQPEECSQEMYKLMLWCWKADPEERPSFMEILNTIEKTILLPKIEVPVVLSESVESKDEENVYN